MMEVRSVKGVFLKEKVQMMEERSVTGVGRATDHPRAEPDSET